MVKMIPAGKFLKRLFRLNRNFLFLYLSFFLFFPMTTPLSLVVLRIWGMKNTAHGIYSLSVGKEELQFILRR